MSGTSSHTQNLLLLKQMAVMQLVIHYGFIIVHLKNKIIIPFSRDKMLSYVYKYFSMCTGNAHISLELIQEVLSN